MESINFFYTSKWTAWAGGQETPYEISESLLESLEEIRETNWPEKITANISFDIYWAGGEYSGIHNYRVGDSHMQTRYSGSLEIAE
jgi:hypothetical protein